MLISELIQHFDLKPEPTTFEDFEVVAVRPLSEAGAGDLSFLSNKKYRDQVATTGASAVLVNRAIPEVSCLQLICPNPYVTLAKALQLLFPEPKPAPGIHPTAIIGQNVTMGEDCRVGPYAVVGDGCQLGAGSILDARVTLSPGVVLGEECRLFTGVVVYTGSRLGDRVRVHSGTVIGSDGFGYAQEGGVHVKVPQIGGVSIGNDVEIGSNTSIDRGALADTVIGDGTKIDNMVQIAHGVKIGKHSVIVSQTGISGSAEIGNHCILAGKVGVVGHVKITDQVVVMGDSVVTKNLDKPGQYAGNPAIPHMKYQRQNASVRMLSKLRDRVGALESQMQEGRSS